MGKAASRGKKPSDRKRAMPDNRKNKSYQRAHPGRGTYTHQQLRSMPEQPRHSALHYLACSCPIKHGTFNCPLTAPSCFVQVEKAKLPFNSRTGALTRYQGSSGSRERTSLLDSSPNGAGRWLDSYPNVALFTLFALNTQLRGDPGRPPLKQTGPPPKQAGGGE